MSAYVRIYVRAAGGSLTDTRQEFGLESFAGQLPSIGDMILAPGVLSHLDRHEPANRTLWQVVGRIFNPRDLQTSVILIVEERPPSTHEADLVS